MKGQRFIRMVVLALGTAALVTGTAQAEPEYVFGARLSAQSGATTASPDWFERTAARAIAGGAATQSVVVPVPEVSERPGQGGLTAAGTSTADWFERAALRATAQHDVSTPRPEVSERPGQGGMAGTGVGVASLSGGERFSWGDAMLGAGSTLGIILLGGAAVLTVRRRGRTLSH